MEKAEIKVVNGVEFKRVAEHSWEVVAVGGTNQFTINANTAGLAAFTSSTGGITRTEAPDADPTPPVVPDPVDPSLPPDIFGGWKFEGFYF